MCGIETLVVFPVTSLHLTIMSRCERVGDFVRDAVPFKTYMKQSGLITGIGKRFVYSVHCLSELHSM